MATKQTKDAATTATANQDTWARIDHLESDLKRLREQLARGTGDVTAQAAAAAAPELPLRERVEVLVRQRPHSVQEIARSLGEPAGPIGDAIKNMKSNLYNAGSATDPQWFWIVGDDVPATELNAAVDALISTGPRTLVELMAATGARQGRVSGAIVQMRRRADSTRVVNLGNDARAKWFRVPEGVALARLRKR